MESLSNVYFPTDDEGQYRVIDSLHAGCFGVREPVWEKYSLFFTSVHNVPGINQTPCTRGTGFLSRE